MTNQIEIVKDLTSDQRNAIKAIHKAAGACVRSMLECQDVWLSDLGDLDNAVCFLGREFNLDD